jgi:hypothetical protein
MVQDVARDFSSSFSVSASRRLIRSELSFLCSSGFSELGKVIVASSVIGFVVKVSVSEGDGVSVV